MPEVNLYAGDEAAMLALGARIARVTGGRGVSICMATSAPARPRCHAA